MARKVVGGHYRNATLITRHQRSPVDTGHALLSSSTVIGKSK